MAQHQSAAGNAQLEAIEHLTRAIGRLEERIARLEKSATD